MKKMLSFVLAAVGIGFAIYRVTVMGQSVQTPPPLQEPARAPYRDSVAGQGIIEAARENVSVAPLVPGVVTKVFVKQWDTVKTGDPFFQLDDRDLQAELGVRAAAARAQAERVARLKAMPRPEDIPPLEANVRQAEARLRDHLDQLARLEGVDDTAAVSQDELKRKRFDVESAR
jgi:multidrug efflux pump subunit AcrA (membrane-fusion protein)